MTDLSGPDLALAVARVMGMCCFQEDGTVYRSVNGRLRYALEWRPDLGNAATWEVHKWVRRTERTVCYETADDGAYMECQITGLRGLVFRGGTDAIALCRAVVATGEADT